ncbi:MAG TPA: kelch repeat-containing protein [Candidatus Limnocylindrales bacterium]|nr:kelch repeat-containing protein [Candidatus Limnocylindrales bacterium]
MTDFDEFERRLALALRSDADEGAASFDPARVARAAIAAARRPVRLAPRLWTRPMLARLAVAAAVGVLAVGAGLYVTRPNHNAVGGSPSPSSSAARPASWTAVGSMTTPRMQQTATLLLDGRVLVVGGNSQGPSLQAERTAELYDPITRSWTATGSMIEDRLQGHTATLLPNGKVLVAGGRGAPTETIVGLASAEVYDPATGTWTATGSMSEDRMDHTATLLPNGEVLVAGGGDSGALASAQLYDPATGTWAATGSMITPRYGHTATVLASGKVLVAGGMHAGGGPMFLSSAELYDSATGTWTTSEAMASPRFWQTATLLSGGQVLVAGGAIEGSPTGDTILASAELFDPATGTWTGTTDMAAVRESFTATVLPDGTVLIAGGKGGAYSQPPHEALASAELYDPGRP